ncbi:MAG: 2-oxoacid:ferredoxin oxidoreductase subunit gamma [Armatimonadetes bacterium]|nr:2-oxoacid:ferredoxin oxidoreductase subunit gamma [Armatimonadota bacterium]NIO74880.1 2-oxoacid:ferredoxin oxidoreductase subunit gamma [Armatimonadota bacterium]NIO95641.1 2-oxoacid:ferredoxin oxidoreductase subunit gamma [Armatimonadota bacterium]
MHHEIIIAGFGGQGVILTGQLLALAANLEDKHVVWNPSYGPEMRGGPSHCTVIISSDPIGSPVVAHPDSELIMDDPSLGRFLPGLKPGGLLIMNSSLVRKNPERKDVRRIAIPANRIAEHLGDVRCTNLVMLGALLGLVPMVEEESLHLTLKERWGGKPDLLDLNQRALRAGMEEAAKAK